MSDEVKHYYWLKFPENFFTSKRIKKLRRLAGGDTFTIIYLKMQLKALKTGGILEYTGLEKTFAEEIALDIEEDPENVGVTLNYLLSCGLIEMADDTHMFLPYVGKSTGSETSSAIRVREFRARLTDEQKEAEREKAKERMRKLREERKCYEHITNDVRNSGVTNVEIEIEKEIEIEIEPEIEKQRSVPLPLRDSNECVTGPLRDSNVDKNSIDKDKNRLDPGLEKQRSVPLLYFPENEILNSAFSDFVENRKKLRKPMTPKAVSLAIDKLNKLSNGNTDLAVEIINQSIMNGWAGLFEINTGRRKGIDWEHV